MRGRGTRFGIREWFALLVCAGVAGVPGARANNIQVSNVTLVNQDSLPQTVRIQFDLSWENSWRVSTGPSNWDAAWVFVKYHTGDGVWRHASLSVTNSDHTSPTGTIVEVGLTANTAVGAFIHRSEDGTGNLNLNDVELQWRYGADGVSNAALVTVDVNAMEMVYVPQGSFYLGDGSSLSVFRWVDGGDTSSPFQVTGPGPLPVDNVAGQLWLASLGGAGTYSNVPAAYPNGYGAFYCMKYPVTQGQYINAYNKSALFNLAASPLLGLSRQFFTGSRPDAVALTPDRAYCFTNTTSPAFSLNDMTRYLDWSGLRPMTDMEYEKACRGPLAPVPGEMAWGTAVGATLPYTLSGDGTSNEAVSVNYNENAGNWWTYNTDTNVAIYSTNGPCRVGMFAKGSYNGTTSGRIQSGATYYGIMNMSDNVNTPVATATPLDLQHVFKFNGSHGDGDPLNGVSTNWTAGLVAIEKGRNFYQATGMEVSDRSGGADGGGVPTSSRYIGIRGVRTAP